ncbi:hypothetical protein HMI54_007601 [Coelomomyces lativittatus]|nr:hypothetical protein HMI54_007601 [Coelomomyces lativittatus]KAJ1509609.1 hypothetical protein HMI55_007326 [Coelomomyces lativittatus]KAJ1514859.1 hypothetical protein HMI56_007221 [Coelomomyces lativittatus]
METSPPIMYYTIQEMRKLRDESRSQNQKIAFVPTMGALHEGHLSLVKLAKTKADVVVVSIFVNPTQFAPNEDLDQYPRTFVEDLRLLQPYQPYVFAPSVRSMYPSLPSSAYVNVNELSQCLEGEIRPHFFKGVCTIVTKLLNCVEPDVVIFGQKDVQQCIVIRTLLSELCLRVVMYVGPTVRETDGLAMSSRNRYLTTQQRTIALALSKALFTAQEFFEKHNVNDGLRLISVVQSMLAKQRGLTTEYVHLGSPQNLSKVKKIESDGAVLCAAVRVDSIRLIDNVLLGCTL